MVTITEQKKTRFMVRVIDKKTGKSKNFSIVENGVPMEKVVAAIKDALIKL